VSVIAGRKTTDSALPSSVAPGPDLSKELYVVCREGKVVELGFTHPGRTTPACSGPDLTLAREVEDQMSRALRAGRPVPETPVEQEGTGFDRMVWSAIREVPFGETVSYSDLASTIDRPGSQRAVARACGRNRVALLVPCHRVVAADGSLGGYRWGVGRKWALIRSEAGYEPG